MYLHWADLFGKYHKGYRNRGYNFQNRNYGTSSIESILEVATQNCFK